MYGMAQDIVIVKSVLNQMTWKKWYAHSHRCLWCTYTKWSDEFCVLWHNIFSIDFGFGFDGDAKWFCLSLSRMINEYTFLMVYCLLLFYYAILTGPMYNWPLFFTTHLRHTKSGNDVKLTPYINLTGVGYPIFQFQENFIHTYIYLICSCIANNTDWRLH